MTDKQRGFVSTFREFSKRRKCRFGSFRHDGFMSLRAPTQNESGSISLQLV